MPSPAPATDPGPRPPDSSLPPFIPTPWLSSPHAQTLWAALVPVRPPALTWRMLELTDGDEVHWAATGPVAGRPVVLILPGLEGSLASPYTAVLLRAIHQRGWCGVLRHARGAAGRSNRLARSYHAGQWDDLAQLSATVLKEGASAVAAVGVSLGANQLLRWLGETGSANPLAAAVAIAAPYDLGAVADHLDRPTVRRYRDHLLRDMRRSTWAKRDLVGVTREGLARLRTFRAFDDALTAPLNGFAGVDDYYQRMSCRSVLPAIVTPTLLVHADDDPMAPAHLLPEPTTLPPCVFLRRTAQGGHVGFQTGWWPRSWLPEAVVPWLAPFIHR